MEQTLIFGKYCANKYRFHMYKTPININKINIKKILLSNKISYGKQGTYIYKLDIQLMKVLDHYT